MYAIEILRSHFLSYTATTVCIFYFLIDNDRLHITRLLENILEAEIIQRMKKSACYFVLNLIEHVWGKSERDIAARPMPPFFFPRDLNIALLEEWNIIPQSLIDTLLYLW